MKRFVFFIIFIFVMGCSSDDSTSSLFDITTNPLTGSWSGSITVTYPGADDAPVTETGSIVFKFTDDGKYEFYEPGVQEPGVWGNGNYESTDSSITLTQTSDEIHERLYDFGGDFDLTINDSGLIFDQILHPELWPESCEISLNKGEVIILQ